MVAFTKQALLAGLQLIGLVASAAISLTPRSVATDLEALLSSSSIDVAARERWNEVGAPVPAVIVSPICERDIKAVVKYCAENNLPLVPQNGGNGWASFNLNGTAVILNLSRLNQVSVAADGLSATIGGGAIIEEVVAAADKAGVLVMTGNCNCVGALGAGLGGGFGNLVGELGMAVDNILSLRVITPEGEAIDVSPTSNPDLFWAMRGAGPNFGIVTYATVKAVPTDDRTAYLTQMTFPGSQVAEVAQTIQDMTLLPNQVVFFIFGGSGDAENSPTVLVTGFLRHADEAAGLEAFAPLLALGPNFSAGSVAPYTSWNAANDFFCARGERKPAFHTTLPAMNETDWPAVWDLYTDFQKLPGAGNSAVLVEVYGYDKVKSVGLGATAVSDELRFNSFGQAVVIPWYTDAALDEQALSFASDVRDIWAFPNSAKSNTAYINFAHGDEDLSAIYGSSLPRLQELKAKHDPKNVFGHWFSLA